MADQEHSSVNDLMGEFNLIHGNRIVRTFVKQFQVLEKKRSKGWDRIYIGIDIHETVHHPTWSTEMSTEYYPDAKECLQLMSEDPEMCLILWSCSLPELNRKYAEAFEFDGITFNYINENPEVTSTPYADFETKLYFNVGLDDKFGFEPQEDWPILRQYLEHRKVKRLEALRNR